MNKMALAHPSKHEKGSEELDTIGSQLTRKIFAVRKIVVSELEMNGRHALWQKKLLLVGRDKLSRSIAAFVDRRWYAVQSEIFQTKNNSALEKTARGWAGRSWWRSWTWFNGWSLFVDWLKRVRSVWADMWIGRRSEHMIALGLRAFCVAQFVCTQDHLENASRSRARFLKNVVSCEVKVE